MAGSARRVISLASLGFVWVGWWREDCVRVHKVRASTEIARVLVKREKSIVFPARRGR